MNPLKRAKSFVASKATKIALVVLPLAALTAIPPAAQATTFSGVNFATGSCTVTTGTGTCTNTQVAAQGGVPGANWIGVSSNAVNSVSSDFGGSSLKLTAAGSASGFFSSTVFMPVSWDFFITNNTGDTVDWDVLYEVFYQGISSVGQIIGHDSTAGLLEIKGKGNFQIPAQSLTGYSIVLTASDPSSGNFTVTVPAGATLDLNPASVTTTPEPSGLLLAAAGVAGLLWRRKKSQSIA